MTHEAFAEGAAPVGAFSISDAGWSFAGALTLDAAAEVLQASQSLTFPASGAVDFSGLTHADSAALAVIMALKRRATAEGRTLAVSGLPASLRSLAIVYGVEDLLTA